MRSYEIPLGIRNARVTILVGASDPADDITYGSLVRTGHLWMQTTSDTPPYGVPAGLFLRDSDGTWQPAPGSTGGPGSGGGTGDTLRITYPISGGSIIWTSGLNFTVGPVSASIAGTVVSSPGDNVTLAAADPTDDRIDVIALDTNGDIVVLTGTPSTPAVAPAVDPALYWGIQHITVEAGATTPAGVITEIVYEENAGTGGGEWATSQSGGTITLNSAASPLVGAVNILGVAVATGHYAQFTESAPIGIEDFDHLVFLFRATAAWPSKRNFRFSLRDGSTFRGQVVTVKHGVYGMNNQDTTTSYLVSIPIAAFAVPTGLEYDSIRMEVGGSGSTVGFKVDSVWLQKGVSGAVGGATLPVGGAIGTALFKQSGADFDTLFRNIVMADIIDLAAALALKAPLAAPALTGAATLDGSALATQPYVDSKVDGLSWKQPVRVATTAAGTLASSFENGDTVDGVVLATGDRILIKDQAALEENGIYTVNASGAPTRSSDVNTGAEMLQATVYVQEGTANADTEWTCTTNAPITLGSSSIAFAQRGSGSAGGAAGGDLSGTYPNPTFNSSVVTAAAKTVLDDATVAAMLATMGGAPLASPTFTGTVTLPADQALTGNPTAPTQSSGNSSTRIASTAFVADAVAKQPEVFCIAVTDETTAITTGDAKITFHMPFAMTLTKVTAGLSTVSSSGAVTVDINEAGSTIFSTKITIDQSEETSETAATPAVLSDTAIAQWAKITVDIDGAGTGAKGLKLYFIGTRT